MSILDDADYQQIRESLDLPALTMTEEEAEEILREHGTSGKEVVNGFIERLLKERSDALAAISARDAEIREVLEGLITRVLDGVQHWCPISEDYGGDCSEACLAARALYEKVQPAKESSDG